MGALMFFVQAVTPTATPNLGSDILSAVDKYGSIALSLASSITSIAAHPVTSGIALGVLALVGVFAWFFIKKKIEDAEIAAAAKDTQTGYDNTAVNQTNQNQSDNNKDHTGEDQLNGMK